jgi:hypothetical protein
MAIADPDVAALARGDRLTVSALDPGETTLDLLLAGSARGGGAVPELEASVPIIVSGEAVPLFEDSWSQTFYNNKWKANLSLQISSAKQDLRLKSDDTFGAMRQLIFQGSKQATYSIDVSLSGVTALNEGDQGGDIKIYGQFDAGQKSEGGSYSTRIELPTNSGSTVGQTAFNIILYRRWSPADDYKWEAGDAVIYIVIQGVD